MEKRIKEGEGFTVKEKEQQEQGSQLDFSTFILSLATSALMQMGFVPDPQTKKTSKNLPLAKQNIDLLALLADKTRGNLSDSEKELLENILTEIRLKFVEVSKS
jgi:uncharacterized membrane protein